MGKMWKNIWFKEENGWIMLDFTGETRIDLDSRTFDLTFYGFVKNNMDGWTIWIHLKQCVTLDPSFNYGKVTFIKRIQKVNYLLLRMEDERG